MGYTATWAGLAVAPMGILPVLLSPFVGKYAPRFDLRLLAGGVPGHRSELFHARRLHQ
jgi:DHA2 family multidrug resistance protein